ncbi:MAG: hypothetical protein ACKO5K_00385, partial [Armatimonadota bacterium]
MLGRRLLLAWLGISVLSAVSKVAQGNGASVATPPKAFIPDVPYMGFAEASRMTYPDKDVLNPSYIASLAMVLLHHGDKLDLLNPKGSGGELPLVPGDCKSLDDLKTLIPRGIPVRVALVATPFAHPINAPELFMLQMENPRLAAEIDRANYSTGILGKMASRSMFSKIQKALRIDKPERLVRESVYLAFRVVIGYDDERKTFQMHDPSFGPNVSLDARDFETMWAQGGRVHDYIASPRSVPSQPAPAVRDRSVREKAAQCFVYGYSASATGRMDLAEEWLNRGLASTDSDKAYEHLFLVELASIKHHRRRFDESIELATRANALCADNPIAWYVLAHVYGDRLKNGDDALAREAFRTAEEIQRDRNRKEALGRFLPTEFWIPLVADVRGWAT